MINVLRMELFRMWKSFSTWIILVIFAGMFLLASGIMGMMTGNAQIALNFQEELFGFSSTIVPESAENTGLNVYVDQEMMAAETMIGVTEFSEIVAMCLMGNTVVLFTAIFMGLFTTGHISSGFRKNIAGVTQKWHLTVSNIFICFLFNLVMLSIGVLILRLVTLFTHETLYFAKMPEMWRYLGVYLLLATAFGLLAAFVSDLTQSRIAALVVPLVYCTLVGDIFYSLIDLLLNKAFGLEDFTVKEYLPYGSILSLDVSSESAAFVKATVSSLVCITIFSVVGLLVKRKQDVK